MRFVRFVVAAGLLALPVAACGGGGKAYIPVDSPLRQWQPPDFGEEEQQPAPAAPAAPAPAAKPG